MNRSPVAGLARFSAVTLGLVVVGVAGYIGFVAFGGSDPGVAGGVMVLAAGTGFAAFFSPCSFPLLLTFLARRSADSPGVALASALRMAGAGTRTVGSPPIITSQQLSSRTASRQRCLHTIWLRSGNRDHRCLWHRRTVPLHCGRRQRNPDRACRSRSHAYKQQRRGVRPRVR